MALSGKVHGVNANLQIQDSGGTLRDFSTDLTSVDLDQATAVAKSTGLGAADETFVIGVRDNKLTFKGLFDDAATTGLYTVLTGISRMVRTFAYSPAGTTSGYAKVTGSLIVTDLKIASPLSGPVTLDVNTQVTGALTFTTN